MSSHAPQTILFVTNEGLVMNTGFSTKLGKGQFGIVDKGATPSAAGMAVVNTFPTTPKDRLFELKLGIAPLVPTRSQSNKAYSSMPFRLSEVVDIKVNAPKIGIDLDELLIGYNGITPDSAIQLSNGDNEVIDITLKGEAIGLLGYKNATVTVKLSLEAPNTGAFTNEEIIENAVERLKNITLIGGVPITNYIEVTPVNSKNPATVTGTGYTFQSIKVIDEGNYSALAKIQAAYPDLLIKREEYVVGSNVSKYTTIREDSMLSSPIVAYVQSVPLQEGDECAVPNCTSIDTTYTWVEGLTCSATGAKYTIQLKDEECGTGNLAELQAAYPNLGVTAELSPAPNGCQTVYSAVVFSEVVCEECSPAFRDLFVTEAPADYKFTSWVKEAKVYDGTALMGIRLKGKPTILAGSEEYRDEIPFIYSSTRISVANESPSQVNSSFNFGTNGRFAVKLLSIATEPESVGGDFYDLEERTRVYYENTQRREGNNYGRLVLGQESNLKPTVHYVDYSIRIRTNRFAQGFSGEVVENIDYHILVDACNYAGVEAIVNALATAVGLPTVAAYA